MNKKCTKCGQNKDISAFNKGQAYADGYHTWCKFCKNESRKKHPDTYQNWVESNRDVSNAIKSKYVSSSPDKVNESKRKWSKANNKKVLAKTRKYQASKLKATPSWLTKAQIDEMTALYESCPQGYHVDHIVPLQGKTVRGLHVPWNLRIIPASENQKKHNKLI